MIWIVKSLHKHGGKDNLNTFFQNCFPGIFTPKCSRSVHMTRLWATLITCSLNEAQDGLFAAVVSELCLLRQAELQSLVFLRECWRLNSWSLVSSCQGAGKVRTRYEANRSVMHDWFRRFKQSCAQSKVHNRELFLYFGDLLTFMLQGPFCCSESCHLHLYNLP